MGSTKGWPVPSWRNRTAMRVPSVAPSASGVFRIEPDFLMRSFTHRRPLALIAHEVAAPSWNTVSNFDERHSLLYARAQFFVLCPMVPTFELGSRAPGRGGLYVCAVHAGCRTAAAEE